MVAFYKHDIPGWRGGTVMLSDRAYRVYHVIVEEIMLHEGPIPLHERSLAGKSNRSVRDFNAALTELIAAGKLSVRGGFIDNSRCENELRSIRDNRETAATGGRKSGEVRRKTFVFSGNAEAPLQTDANIREKRREEEEKKEQEPSVPRPKRVRTTYPDAFEELWSGYPTDANMSKKEAHEAWRRLSEEDQEGALASLPGFRAYCQSHADYRPIHLCRYLAKARFEGFLKLSARTAQKSVYIRQDDPRWRAWEAYYKRTKGTAPPTDSHRGWHFPTEFPPATENAA